MKLRFCDEMMRDKFTGLVCRHGYTPTVYIDGGWWIVESAIDGKARRSLMSEWAKISMEDSTKPNNQQRKLL